MNYFFFFIFLIIVLTVYSLLNYYYLKKHHSVVSPKSLGGMVLKMLIFTLILTPVATTIFSYNNIPLGAALTGFTGYSWLAFLFLFLIIHGSVDLVLFIAEKTGYKPKRIGEKAIFITAVALNMGIIIYGYYEAANIQVEHIQLNTKKLKKGEDITLMQISDVHFSPLISVSMADNIAEIFRKEQPDLLISTGDLLDKAVRNQEEIEKTLQSLQPPMGKYAITGNHEFIAGIEPSQIFTKNCGFKILRDTLININKKIILAGVDDKTKSRFEKTLLPVADVEVLIQNKHLEETFTIFLKHQPHIGDETFSYFDLALAGHTHGGQIFPFSLFVRFAFKYLKGLYLLDNETYLYVNRGTGTWGPPIRFLAPPEITIFTIKGTR